MTKNPMVAIFLLLVAAGIFFAYVSPTWYGAIAADKAQIAGYDTALAAADTYQAKVTQLSAARNAIAPEDLARLGKFLPDGIDNVQLILDLDALAARSGLQLANFGTADSSAGSSAQNPLMSAAGPVDSIDITVSALGTYKAMNDFVNGVEHSLRLIDLVGLTVKQSDTGVYTYQMTLRLYWIR